MATFIRMHVGEWTATVKGNELNKGKLVAAFKKAPEEVANALRITLKQQLGGVQSEAQHSHRFITRTGLLKNSIEKDVDQSGLIGVVQLNSAVASYGKYVHEGHHSWAPDQFLYIAFEKKRQGIVNAINETLNAIFQKVGLV